MRRIIYSLILMCSVSQASMATTVDSIPATAFSRPLLWHAGMEVNPAFVLGTNDFMKGHNVLSKKINSAFSGDMKAGFSFSPDTKEGMLYHGLYQGVGIGVNTFFSNSLLGTPVSAYIYQGAPIVHFNHRMWLGYEWRFGAAMGWKHYDEVTAIENEAVSTSVTALLGIGAKLHYALSDRWQLSLGINAIHYSNGNTSWPNAGVNSIGATIGLTYIITPRLQAKKAPEWLIEDADKGRWHYDLLAYGAWRQRSVNVGYEPQLCPGKFGIVGLQFSPLRQLNRYVAVGPALDMQWDESAGLEPYWIGGTSGSNIKFERPPFGKQLSVGVSAHAELTMPIFSVNAGIGYDFVNPKGDRRCYQSLSLKTFVTSRLFLNVGYRLGNFQTPQNLILGLGLRL